LFFCYLFESFAAASALSAQICFHDGMVFRSFEKSIITFGISMFCGQIFTQVPQQMQAVGRLSSGINSIFDALFTPGA
jgi:hypothetical protein